MTVGQDFTVFSSLSLSNFANSENWKAMTDIYKENNNGWSI